MGRHLFGNHQPTSPSHQAASALSDLETARRAEAQRRHTMLGSTADQAYDYRALRERAQQTCLPMSLLKAWHTAYRAHGLAGLQPEWQPLGERSLETALQRRAMLGPLADADMVTEADLHSLAAHLGWRIARVRRWVQRYRQDGLWALAAENNPHRHSKQSASTAAPRMPGTLSEKDLDDIEQRTLRLGWLLEKPSVSDADVKQRADEAGCAPRTLWRDLSLHRRYGPLGLVRHERFDKGGRHGDTWYTDIITACRLGKKDATVRWVYDEVCRRARRCGMEEPSFWRVRSVCEEINGSIKAIADGREDVFRNSYGFAGRLKIHGVVYEIDHTRVDVLVRDLRSAKNRSQSGITRPWLTVVIEATSRVVVAAVFGYDQPDRFTVGEAMRQSLIISDVHPYGGIPGEMRIDRGKDLISKYVAAIARSLGMKIHPTYCPEHKPYIERFFGTLNTRLWSAQPGYVASSVQERNPTAERDVSLTIAQLEAQFWTFINDTYHQEVHCALGMTPLAYWDAHCFTEAADVRELDVLMMEPEQRKVTKGRISMDGREYFHPELAVHIGTRVLVRRPIHYGLPDTVEVYVQGQWICTAVALDSDLADTVTAEDARTAQKAQRRAARAAISQAQALLARDDQQHALPAADTALAENDTYRSTPSENQVPGDAPTSQTNMNFLRQLGQHAKKHHEEQRNEHVH